MEKFFIRLTGALLIAAFYISCQYPSDHDIRISVHEDRDRYEFSAYFDKSKSPEIAKLVDEAIGTDTPLIHAGDYYPTQVTLNDGTRFELQAFPGEMYLALNRHENSAAGYQRIREIGERIKNRLAGK